MPVTFRDFDGTTRLAGEILIGGTTGDVATVQADGTIAPAPGGSQTVSFASERLSGSTTAFDADPVPFNVSLADTDGYDPGITGVFTVPAGKGGVFLVGCLIEVLTGGGETITVALAQISTSGAYPNILGALGPVNTLDTTPPWYGTVTGLMVLADGDSVSVSLDVSGSANAKVGGGGNGSYFWLSRLGDAP